MTITALGASDLYKTCDFEKFNFNSTAELEERLSTLGQDRALSAVELGINIKSKGYNIYCLGPEGTGKTSLVKRILENEAENRPAPKDWCYVYNFEEAHRPKAVSLEAGAAVEFSKDIDKLIEDLKIDFSAMFESGEYKSKEEKIFSKYDAKKEAYIEDLQKKAVGRKVTLLRMAGGIVVAPTKDGEVLDSEAFDGLNEAEQLEIMADLDHMQEELNENQKDIAEWEKSKREEIDNLKEKFSNKVAKKSFSEIKKKYVKEKDVTEYLKALEEDVVKNVDLFLPIKDDIVSRAPEEDEEEMGAAEEDAISMILSKVSQSKEESLKKYKVNVIVKNNPGKGAPIVHLDHPTQGNLVGKVERIAQYGALLSDFTLIKAGALHEANGGFLLVDAQKVLTQSFAWDSLKRAIRSKKIKIEAPSDETSFTTISIDPEPIPLDVKIILIGDYELYELLSERDSDFCDLFKVEADFCTIMDRTEENEIEYAKLIGSLSKKKKLRSLNSKAVARVIEHASRLAGDSEKLTAHISSIGDLLREADYWARKSNSNQIGKNHIDQAIESQYYRSDRVKESMLEQIERGTVMIDTEGKVVGQINGLVVYTFTRNSFGKPARITAQARMGKGEVLDIEREIELSGPIHSKGMLILQSLLANRFAKESPLSLSASIVFEQSYGGVDGDSASSTEYYCLLSAISEVPIKQNIAVTGSINQFGQSQPIGGVNEKIEGFFDVCVYRGLTGEQGVIIPRTNVADLMLRQDVIDAVKEGNFYIWAIDDVDDGIELLTGYKAGKRDENGQYPIGTMNYLVEKKLHHYYKQYARFAKETYGRIAG